MLFYRLGGPDRKIFSRGLKIFPCHTLVAFFQVSCCSTKIEKSTDFYFMNISGIRVFCNEKHRIFYTCKIHILLFLTYVIQLGLESAIYSRADRLSTRISLAHLYSDFQIYREKISKFRATNISIFISLDKQITWHNIFAQLEQLATTGTCNIHTKCHTHVKKTYVIHELHAYIL